MKNFIVAVSLVLTTSSAVASTQELDAAMALYKAGDYAKAALSFHDLLQNDVKQERRDKAEIYLAETLRKLDLHIPAMFYYTDLFRVGRSGRNYLNAIEGLLAVQAWSRRGEPPAIRQPDASIACAAVRAAARHW